MNSLRWIILLQFTTISAIGQPGQSKAPGAPKQPEATVRSLYREVVARHPVGIPGGADKNVFAPYLSKSLLRRIDLAVACGKDWYRQHPDPNLKPEFAWLEFGLFTGGNEQVAPRAFHVERAQPQKDGSFRVYVRLTWGSPAEPWIWHVAAIAVQENGHFVIDDVIFLKEEKTGEDESRLSEILTAGCNGPRWIGYRDQRSDSSPKD